MMNTNNTIQSNGVNERESNARPVSPGRLPVVNQAGVGRHLTTGEVRPATQRMSYTREDNIKIMECYYSSEPMRRGYMSRMAKIWQDRGGFELTENRLAMQARTIIRKEWLTKEELDEIRIRETEDQGAQAIEEGQATVEVIPPSVLESSYQSQGKEYHHPVRQDDIMIESRLSDEKKELVEEIKIQRGRLQMGREKLTNIRHIDRRKIVEELRKINEVIEHVPIDNITELNDTFYASAAIVTKKLAKNRSEKKDEPPWKKRLKEKVTELRKDISRVVKARNEPQNDRFRRKIEAKHNIKRKGYQLVEEELKQRLKATAAKIKRYDDRVKQYQQNRMFENNQKRFYNDIQSNLEGENEIPDGEESKDFWTGVWGQAIEHDGTAPWIERVTRKLEGRRQEEIIITENALKRALVKLPNWKAPGPDAVQGFWIKNLTNLHRKLVKYLNECLETAQTPSWMTTGRTVLIQKDKTKGRAPGNYRPITCLPIVWKLMTSMVAEEIYRHLEDNDLIGEEQKGCRSGYKGTKDHLMLDKVILKDCKNRKKGLAMGWIDYQKAYDLVPHSWIIEALRMVGVDEKAWGFLKASMSKWNTNLECGGRTLANVKIKRGIFQGDSLSPLLFIVCLIPLSVILREAKQGYTLSRPQSGKINHLLYMDDLKLYGKNKKELESLVQTVRIFTQDIRMKFGIQKCATVVMKRGKREQDEGILLPDGELMKDLGEQDYKYLGVLEADDIKMKEMKEKVRKEYYRRTRLLLESKLNGGNVIKAVNTWAVAVLRYAGGILDWTKEELEVMDRKTRKLMTINRALHPRANVARLYLARDAGGRGLRSVKEAIRTEEHGLSDYVKHDNKGLNRYLRSFEKKDTKQEYKDHKMEEKQQEWKNKALHGQYTKIADRTDAKKTYKWIRNGYMKKETEGLLMAAQDQALPTRWKKVHIEKQGGTAMCRMCNEREETVFHILSECPKMAQTEYRKRHDKVAQLIHWNLCKRYQLEHRRNWYEHQAESVTENEKAKILWDCAIQTDHIIQARRPDIVVQEKEINHTWIIDIAVPGDARVTEKEREKVERYQDLAREIRRLWKTSVTVIPIVVGALGAVANLHEQMEMLEMDKKDVDRVQFSALLGSARILRKVLDIPG
jgi:hypothetical protein